MATGLMGSICPPSTQFDVYNRIPTPKQLVIYSDFGYEAYPDILDQAFQFLGKL